MASRSQVLAWDELESSVEGVSHLEENQRVRFAKAKKFSSTFAADI